MNIGELTASLGIDTKGFDNGIKRATTNARNFSSVLSALGVTAVAAFAYKLNSMSKEWEGLYRVQEQAEAGLRQAMISMGRYTDEAYKGMLDYASALQRVTTFGDEAIISATKMLMTYRNIGDDVMPRVIRAMTDLSALTGRDLVASANLLGKASMGLVGELRRVGISVDELMFKEQGFLGVLKQIEEQVGGQAKALAATNSGGMEQYLNIVNDLKERLGELTLSMRMEFVPVLYDVVVSVSDWFDNQKRLQELGVTNWLDTMRDSLVDVRDLFKDIVGLIQAIDPEMLLKIAQFVIKTTTMGTPLGQVFMAYQSLNDWRKAHTEVIEPETTAKKTLSSTDSIREMVKEVEAHKDLIEDKAALDTAYYAERVAASAEANRQEIVNDAEMLDMRGELLQTNLKSKVEMLKSLLEFKAKVDVADIEAATERIKAAQESVSGTIESSQRVLSDLFNVLLEAPVSGKTRRMIEDQIQNDAIMREDAFELQRKLIEAMSEYFQLMNQRMRSGDSTIKVSADGLKPHLESILWEVLDACQVKVDQEYSEFLLGLGEAL